MCWRNPLGNSLVGAESPVFSGVWSLLLNEYLLGLSPYIEYNPIYIYASQFMKYKELRSRILNWDFAAPMIEWHGEKRKESFRISFSITHLAPSFSHSLINKEKKASEPHIMGEAGGKGTVPPPRQIRKTWKRCAVCTVALEDSRGRTSYTTKREKGCAICTVFCFCQFPSYPVNKLMLLCPWGPGIFRENLICAFCVEKLQPLDHGPFNKKSKLFDIFKRKNKVLLQSNVKIKNIWHF